MSAILSLLKPDIWNATKDFLCCRCNQECEAILNENEDPSNWKWSSFRSLGPSTNSLAVEVSLSSRSHIQKRSSQSLYLNDQISDNSLVTGLDSLQTVQEHQDLESSTVDDTEAIEVP